MVIVFQTRKIRLEIRFPFQTAYSGLKHGMRQLLQRAANARRTDDMPKLNHFLDEYVKHSVLNFGQFAQGLRYLYSHPDIDSQAKRGSVRHFILSVLFRSRRAANDLFFALIPPHWHHTPEQLSVMRPVPLRKWFFYGYCPWRFDETGAPRTDLSTADPRWDPRCKDPQK
jgi:hypothetical protein